jgi:putative heme degradation protein
VAGIRAANQVLTADQGRTLRAIHVLEQAETAAAKELLAKLARANLEAGLSGEARAALERAEKRAK